MSAGRPAPVAASAPPDGGGAAGDAAEVPNAKVALSSEASGSWRGMPAGPGRTVAVPVAPSFMNVVMPETPGRLPSGGARVPADPRPVAFGRSSMAPLTSLDDGTGHGIPPDMGQ